MNLTNKAICWAGVILSLIMVVAFVETGFLLYEVKHQTSNEHLSGNWTPTQVQNLLCLNIEKPETEKAKSWIDLADTALTIGLSALIGGGIGIFGTWLSSRGEAEKEYLNRKRKMLEDILDQFNELAEQQSVYWANLANAVYLRDKNDSNDPLTKAMTDELDNCEQKLFEKYRILIPARSKLHLIGAEEVVNDLDQFREVSDQFFRKANVGNPNCTKQFLDETKIKITASRDMFYNSMGVVYGRKTL